MEEGFWLIPVSVIVGGVTYAIIKEQAWARVRELEVRERIAMIEKGHIPPPEANPRGFESAMAAMDQRDRGVSPWGPRRAPARYRRAGITLMGIGFGLMLMIGLLDDAASGIGIGGFLVVFGLALFINSLFEDRDLHRSQATPSASDAGHPRPSQHQS